MPKLQEVRLSQVHAPSGSACELRSPDRLGIKGSYFCDQDCFKKSCEPLSCRDSGTQLTRRGLAQAHSQHRPVSSSSGGGQ
jgi:hypothetical protein